MKRKRKTYYWIQNWSSTRTFWWNRGDWRQNCDSPDYDKSRKYLLVNGKPSVIGAGGASSITSARTLQSALRKARRLKSYGGHPLITRFFYKHGKRYVEDFELN
jgi:hypothetical protein